MEASGLAADKFNSNDKHTPVLLPILNEKVLKIPEYFITQIISKKLKDGQRKFKLFVPTTGSRNLSTRKKKKSIKVLRVNDDELHLEDSNGINPPPKLSEFSKKDKLKLIEFFKSVKEEPQILKLDVKPGTKRPKKTIQPEPEPAEPEPAEPEPAEPQIRTQKKRGRRLKYATEDEAKLAQAQQKRDASKKLYQSLTAERLKQKAIKKGTYKPNNMETQNYENENDIVQGEGIVNNIEKGVKSVVKKVIKKTKKLGKLIEKVLQPDKWMPPSVKEIMKNNGEEIITSITLRRNPVSSLITGAMNAVSLGSFKKKLDRQPYDKLFHLAMLVQTSNTKFLLEKIERVNVTKSIDNPEGLEILDCPLDGKQISVFDLIDKTKTQMGKTKFLDYNAVNNNCQVFLMNVLDANGLLNETNKSWVKQNTEVLFKGNKTLAKISKKLTDIGASANVLLKGGKLKNNENNKISSNIIMSEFNYLLPQTESQHRQLINGNTDDLPEPLQAGKGISRTFKRIGKQIKSGVDKGVDKVDRVLDKADDIQSKVNQAISKMKNVPAEAKAHLKMIGLDVAEILVKRGIPVTVGTLAGMLATAATGNPALGIAASVSAGYAAQIAADKLAKEEDISGSSGSGVAAGLCGGMGAGLYSGYGGRGMDDSDDECSCNKCEMCGRGLFIDRKFSIRDLYDGARSIPKQVNKNVKSLKQGKPKEDIEGGRMMGSDPVTYSPRGKGVIPKQPKVIDNGVVGPSMSGRGGPPGMPDPMVGRLVRGSPEMKEKMAKLRAMRKKK